MKLCPPPPPKQKNRDLMVFFLPPPPWPISTWIFNQVTGITGGGRALTIATTWLSTVDARTPAPHKKPWTDSIPLQMHTNVVVSTMAFSSGAKWVSQFLCFF